MLKRILSIAVVSCITMLLCGLPKALSLEELDTYSAACHCCNATGGPNCARDGYGVCAETAWNDPTIWGPGCHRYIIVMDLRAMSPHIHGLILVMMMPIVTGGILVMIVLC